MQMVRRLPFGLGTMLILSLVRLDLRLRGKSVMPQRMRNCLTWNRLLQLDTPNFANSSRKKSGKAFHTRMCLNEFSRRLQNSNTCVSLDLYFWYNSAFGSPLSRSLGIGYTKELIARLTHTPISTHDSTTNSTLDDNTTTFPLKDSLYVDATHEVVILNGASTIISHLRNFRPNTSDDDSHHGVESIQLCCVRATPS